MAIIDWYVAEWHSFLMTHVAANNSSMKITSAARSVIHSVPNFAWSKITRRGLYLSCLSSSHAAIRLLFPGVAGHEEYWTISTSMCIISVIFGEYKNLEYETFLDTYLNYVKS